MNVPVRRWVAGVAVAVSAVVMLTGCEVHRTGTPVAVPGAVTFAQQYTDARVAKASEAAANEKALSSDIESILGEGTYLKLVKTDGGMASLSGLNAQQAQAVADKVTSLDPLSSWVSMGAADRSDQVSIHLLNLAAAAGLSGAAGGHASVTVPDAAVTSTNGTQAQVSWSQVTFTSASVTHPLGSDGSGAATLPLIKTGSAWSVDGPAWLSASQTSRAKGPGEVQSSISDAERSKATSYATDAGNNPTLSGPLPTTTVVPEH